MLKCKHCSHEAPDIPELKSHAQMKHPTQWSAHVRNMIEFDHTHAAELGKECPICPHRRGDHDRTNN